MHRPISWLLDPESHTQLSVSTRDAVCCLSEMGSSRTPELFSAAETLGCNLITDDNETLPSRESSHCAACPIQTCSCPWVQSEVDSDKVYNKTQESSEQAAVNVMVAKIMISWEEQRHWCGAVIYSLSHNLFIPGYILHCFKRVDFDRPRTGSGHHCWVSDVLNSPDINSPVFKRNVRWDKPRSLVM